MIEILPIALKVITELRFWFDSGFERIRSNNKERQETVGVFRAAVTETRIYLQRLHRGDVRDFGAEAELARAWSQVSSLVKPFSEEASDACFEFSKFWAQAPDGLDTSKLARKVEKLNRVGKENMVASENIDWSSDTESF